MKGIEDHICRKKNWQLQTQTKDKPFLEHCWHDVDNEVQLSKGIAPQCSSLIYKKQNNHRMYINTNLQRTRTSILWHIQKTNRLPALASSTGVGLWRLSSSVCHTEVISLIYKYQPEWIMNHRRIKQHISTWPYRDHPFPQ